MTRWTVEDLPSLDGRTMIITGAAGGLGLVTARELARAGARVVLAVRNVDKGAAAAASIAGRAEVRQLDVSDLASIRRFAAQWHDGVDVLINNAGIMDVPLRRTADGFETQMATNFLGPYALTNLLLPHLTDRVVFVSSQLHRQGKMYPDDINALHRTYRSGATYNDSKLAVVSYALELQRRLTASGSAVRSLVAHPGIADTTLASHAVSGRITHALRFLFNDVERGALPVVYAATQDVAGGSYVGPDGFAGMRGYPAVGTPSKAAVDPAAAERLWQAAAALTGTGLEVPGVR